MTPISTIVTSAGQCLARPLRGPRGSWWLRHASGTFHSLRQRLPGHRPFNERVCLPEGRYLLGVGDIRLVVQVTADGASTFCPDDPFCVDASAKSIFNRHGGDPDGIAFCAAEA